MKKFNLILVTLLSFTAFSQNITSSNFKTELAGTWTMNFCDANWNALHWTCVDTLTFSKTGFVNSVRTCERPKGYPEEDEYNGVHLGREEWTKFDSKKMILYYKTFEEWENDWSKEEPRYRVFSITKDEIKAEFDGWSEVDGKEHVNYVIYKRVK